MNWFKRKTNIELNGEPYAFIPGKIYVIEYNQRAVAYAEIIEVSRWLNDLGVEVHFVPSNGNHVGLYPVEAKEAK